MAYPSTFLDLQNAVIGKLRLDATADLQRVKDWINQVYAQVVIETQSNVVSSTSTLTAGVGSYTLPAGIIRVIELYVTPVGGAQSQPLVETTLEDILRRRQAGGGVWAQGGVSYYTLAGSTQLEFYPAPSSADLLSWYYVAAPTVLSANGDVPSAIPEPYASKVLEYGALVEGADFEQAPSEASYRGIYEDWMRRYRAHLAKRGGEQQPQLAIAGGSLYPPHDPSTDTGW